MKGGPCGCLGRIEGGGGGGGSTWALPLAVLFLQTGMPLLIRHTRRSSAEDLYHPASLTLLAEVTKCIVAFAFMYAERRRDQQLLHERGGFASVRKAVWETGRRFLAAVWRLSALLLPAAFYFASNLTAMHALSHLRSSIFSAVMNARIVFAALLSMVLLKKRVSGEQWRAIFIIVSAASILCLEDAQTRNGDGVSVTNEKMGMVIAIGTAAVSAAGGVFVEKYLAEPPSKATSTVRPLAPAAPAAVAAAHGIDSRAPERSSLLWEQQGVLALFSAAFADLYLLLFLPEAVRGRALLRGWTPMAAFLMGVQALQGIVVAMAIQRFGIVVRLILGTISICLCILAEGLLLMEPIAFREGLSIVLVILGSIMYQQSAHAAAGKAAAAAVASQEQQKQQKQRACAHCGRKGQSAARQGEGEAVVPDTEGGIFRKIMGTRRQRPHSPTPLDDREGRRWW